jgi:hypothetical protein
MGEPFIRNPMIHIPENTWQEIYFAALAVVALALLPALGAAATSVTMGPLRVHPTNPRYFADGSGRAVYLTGSHTWNALSDARVPLDYTAYLDFLQRHNHNFMKFRAWDSWLLGPPLCYLRTGPGNALDGQPKLDVNQFNQAYFDRMRERIIAARDRNIYVLIMLFSVNEANGDVQFSIPDRIPPEFSEQPWSTSPNRWIYHPYNKMNNINGIDGGSRDNSVGASAESMSNPAITSLREAYIRKVVDTVNDLDNVLFEIANESHNYLYDDPSRLAPPVNDWQDHMIDYLHAYEKTKPQQHPVVISMVLIHGNGPRGEDAYLYASAAEGISPGGKQHFQEDPPATDGRKVVLTDPDHYGWTRWRGTRSWAWKSFVRGMNPIALDSLPTSIRGNDGGCWGGGDMAVMVDTRKAMGHTRSYATRMDLAAATPRNDLASTGFCLASPGSEYLVYQPNAGAFSVNLLAGAYHFEWFNPSLGSVAGTGELNAPGGLQSFTPPFAGDGVLFLAAAP